MSLHGPIFVHINHMMHMFHQRTLSFSIIQEAIITVADIRGLRAATDCTHLQQLMTVTMPAIELDYGRILVVTVPLLS